MAKKACKVCKRLLEDDKCALHPSNKLIESWKGRIIILNPDKSELANKLKIKDAGEYAIRI